jgi:NAD+ synthase (glutamine-hydrolysing)
MIFPELGLSSYAIDDLLLQDALLDEVERSVAKVVEASKSLFPVLVVGAPLSVTDRLYNTAIVIHPRPDPRACAQDLPAELSRVLRKATLRVRRQRDHGHRSRSPGQQAPFGNDLLFRSTGSVDVTFHVEICEDIWMPVPPSSHAALAGAEVLLNLSASNITIGKAELRRLLCGSQSARRQRRLRLLGLGPGESTTDLAWDGHAAIYECGDQLAEARASEGVVQRHRRCRSRPHPPGAAAQRRLRRLRAAGEGAGCAVSHRLQFAFDAPKESVALERPFERFPVRAVRSGQAARELLRGLQHPGPGAGAAPAGRAGTQNAVIGVSGGLDSTHALIVTCRAMDQLGLSRGQRQGVHACRASAPSSKTYDNAGS